MRIKYCFAPNCPSNTENDPGLTFHSLPVNDRILQQWAKNMGREEKISNSPKSTQKHYYVCGKHFLDSCFQTYERKKLNRGAIPTIFDLPKEKKPLPNLKITNIIKRDTSKPIILNHQIVFPNVFESIEDVSQPMLPQLSQLPTEIDLAQDEMDSNETKITVELPELSPVHTFSSAKKKKPETPKEDSVETLLTNLFQESKSTSKPEKQSIKFKDKRQKYIKPSKKHVNVLLQNVKKTIQTLQKCEGCCMKLFNGTTIFNNKVIQNLDNLKNMPVLVKTYVRQQLIKNRQKTIKYKKHEIPFYAALYNRNRTAYHYLSLMFNIPTSRKINIFLKSTCLDSGINTNLLHYLRQNSNIRSPLDKYCTLLFKEIKICPFLKYNNETDTTEGLQTTGTERTCNIINRCFVFMLNGLHSAWKQPIAYYLVSNTCTQLHEYITDVISNVHAKTEFVVVATVSQLNTTNINAIYTLMDSESNGFIYKVNNCEIIHFFDPLHLLKQLKNNFVNRNILYDGEREAKWEHVKTSNIDQRQIFTAATSRTLKTMSRSYVDTADFCTFVNNLYLLLTENEKISEFVNHSEFWNQALTTLNSMKFTSDSKTGVSYVAQAFILNINNIKSLWNSLKKLGFKYIVPKYLNLEPLDNFLGIMSHFYGKWPTSTQFQESFKISLFNDKFSHYFICSLKPDLFYIDYDYFHSDVLYKMTETVHFYSAENIVKFLAKHVLRNCDTCSSSFRDKNEMIARIQVLQSEVYKNITAYLNQDWFIEMLCCYANDLWHFDCAKHKHKVVRSVCYIMVKCFIEITNKMLWKQQVTKK